MLDVDDDYNSYSDCERGRHEEHFEGNTDDDAEDFVLSLLKQVSLVGKGYIKYVFIYDS